MLWHTSCNSYIVTNPLGRKAMSTSTIHTLSATPKVSIQILQNIEKQFESIPDLYAVFTKYSIVQKDSKALLAFIVSNCLYMKSQSLTGYRR